MCQTSMFNEAPQPAHKFRSKISAEVRHVPDRRLQKNSDECYQAVQDMFIDLNEAKNNVARTPCLVPSQQGTGP